MARRTYQFAAVEHKLGVHQLSENLHLTNYVGGASALEVSIRGMHTLSVCRASRTAPWTWSEMHAPEHATVADLRVLGETLVALTNLID